MDNELKTLHSLLGKTRAKTETAVVAYRNSLPSYHLEKKLEDLIASLETPEKVTKNARPIARTKHAVAPYTLTTEKQKAAILEGIDEAFEATQNRTHSIDELEERLISKKIKVPGKSPRSTLAALLSRNKAKYERVGDKQYRAVSKNSAKGRNDLPERVGAAGG